MKALSVSHLMMAAFITVLAGCGSTGSDVGGSNTATTNEVNTAGITPAENPLAAPAVDPSVVDGVKPLYATGVSGTMAPADFRTHYNVPANLDGTGTTVAIVDAAGSGSPEADLAKFSSYYNLPACTVASGCLTMIDLSNGVKPILNSSSDWYVEVALDIQSVHAIAPKAKIILVTAKSSSMNNMLAAVVKASQQPGVVAISMSWGGSESVSETSIYDVSLKSIQVQGIVLFASAGDSGNNGTNQEYPAVSPYVTSVGGTSIIMPKTTNSLMSTLTSEIAWTYGGGGMSKYETMPSFQTSTLLGTPVYSAAIGQYGTVRRMMPDVSYDADNTTSPMSIIVNNNWMFVGGTSVGSPHWAAIFALLVQDRVNDKNAVQMKTLVMNTMGGFNGMLYNAKVATTDFYDILTGSDKYAAAPGAAALYSATKGYDAVTGLGVPNVTALAASF